MNIVSVAPEAEGTIVGSGAQRAGCGGPLKVPVLSFFAASSNNIAATGGLYAEVILAGRAMVLRLRF